MSLGKIPQIIHLICADREPPSKYSFFIDKIRSLHPSWKINIWDDDLALRVVHESFRELEEMYISYPMPIQRADIFRVMITYLLGGFYMDMDMLCFKKLDELCKYEMVLGVEKTLSRNECLLLNHKHEVRIANYMFGSVPRHNFWLEFLDAAKARSNNMIQSESDILETTGPGLLTVIFHELRNKYENITLLPNDNNPCLKSCGTASCHFGDFAAHLHVGSWRWKPTPA